LQPMHKINYIKNEYLIDLSKEGENAYNEAAKNMVEGSYETSGAYLADAESPTDVANRQIILMAEVEELFYPGKKKKKSGGKSVKSTTGSTTSVIKGDLAVREESITGKPPTFAITP